MVAGIFEENSCLNRMALGNAKTSLIIFKAENSISGSCQTIKSLLVTLSTCLWGSPFSLKNVMECK